VQQSSAAAEAWCRLAAAQGGAVRVKIVLNVASVVFQLEKLKHVKAALQVLLSTCSLRPYNLTMCNVWNHHLTTYS